MKAIRATICAAAALLCSPAVLQAAPGDAVAPGFSLGVVYTPDDDVKGFGWHAGGSVEFSVGGNWELRTTLGLIDFDGDSGGPYSKARYGFFAADVLAAEFISPAGGIGLYHVDLKAPSGGEDKQAYEPGVNAGVRVFVPYANHRNHALTVDLRVHWIDTDGPSLMVTLGGGIVF